MQDLIDKYCYAYEIEDVSRVNDVRACHTCHKRIHVEPIDRVNYKLSRNKLADVIPITAIGYMVSGRFKKAWEEEGLAGIEKFLPIKIEKIGKKHVSPDAYDYYAVVFESPSAMLDLEGSGCYPYGKYSLEVRDTQAWSRVTFCPECGKPMTIRDANTNEVFDSESSHPHGRLTFSYVPKKDIFRIKNLSLAEDLYFFTKRIVDFIIKHQFTNCYAVPVEEYVSYTKRNLEVNPYPELCPPNNEPTKVESKSAWRARLTATIECRDGRLRIADVSDLQDEQFALSIPAVSGKWNVKFIEEEVSHRIIEVQLWATDEPNEPEAWRPYAEVSTDSGMLYIRTEGLTERGEDSLYSKIMEIQATAAPEWNCHAVIKIGKANTAVLFYTGYGDGDYPVYVDGDQAKHIKLTF